MKRGADLDGDPPALKAFGCQSTISIPPYTNPLPKEGENKPPIRGQWLVSMAVPSGGGRKFRDRLIQNLMYSFDPVRVFRLHQDRPEAGDSLRITLDFRGGKIEEVHR